MLRGLGSWLGLERAGEEQLLPAGKRSGPAEQEEEAEAGPAEQEQGELQGDSEALLSQAKGFGSECPGLPPFQYELRKPACKCAFRLSPLPLFLKEERFLNICCVCTMGGGLCVARIDLSV